MSQEYIQVKKQRELGEILSITFKFLRENYKALGKVLIKIAGPAFILLLAAVSYYSWSTVGLSFFSSTNGSSDFIISLAILIFAYLLYITSMTGTIFHAIFSYSRNKGEIISSEVVSGMKQDFGKLLLLIFLSWVIVFGGLVLFFIPGIYFLVPISLSTAILVFRRESVSGSLSECFALVKDNWWMTFASLLVIGLIVYVIGLVFQLPAIFYFVIKAITTAQQGSAANPREMFGTGYIVISVISSLIQYIVYSITPIGIAFIYFHLNEKKNFTGTYETIENLGNN